MLGWGTQFARDRFPVYLADVPSGPFYGIPAIDPRGHKLARHYGRRPRATGENVLEVDQHVTEFLDSEIRRANGGNMPSVPHSVNNEIRKLLRPLTKT